MAHSRTFSISLLSALLLFSCPMPRRRLFQQLFREIPKTDVCVLRYRAKPVASHSLPGRAAGCRVLRSTLRRRGQNWGRGDSNSISSTLSCDWSATAVHWCPVRGGGRVDCRRDAGTLIVAPTEVETIGHLSVSEILNIKADNRDPGAMTLSADDNTALVEAVHCD